MNSNNLPEPVLNKQPANRTVPPTHLDAHKPIPVGGSSLLFKHEVYHIVGCAIEVLNALGHGLHEKPYENALVVEFGLRQIPFAQQPRFPVVYKAITVGEYVPDLIVFNSVVLDAKVIEAITDHERGQILNYLRITGLQVGVILNFKRSKLEWERLVLTENK